MFFRRIGRKFRVDSLHTAMGFGIAIALSSSMSGAEVPLEMYLLVLGTSAEDADSGAVGAVIG